MAARFFPWHEKTPMQQHQPTHTTHNLCVNIYTFFSAHVRLDLNSNICVCVCLFCRVCYAGASRLCVSRARRRRRGNQTRVVFARSALCVRQREWEHTHTHVPYISRAAPTIGLAHWARSEKSESRNWVNWLGYRKNTHANNNRRRRRWMHMWAVRLLRLLCAFCVYLNAPYLDEYEFFYYYMAIWNMCNVVS